MQTLPQQTERSPSPSLAVEPSSTRIEPVLQAIPPQYLGDVLPMILPLLESIVERSKGRYSVPGMLTRFARKEWYLWIVWDGAVRAIVGTELYLDISGMKCCMIRFATGRDAAGWTHLLDQIEDWARSEGCARMDMIARKGWAKHLPEYRMSHVFLEKDLTA